MVERTSARSGFDLEVLLSERYLRDALLAQVEAGLLPLELDVADPAAGLDVHLTFHPPADRELHPPGPEVALPAPADGSFAVALLPDDPDGADLELTVVCDVRDRASGRCGRRLEVGLLFAVRLVADTDDRGLQHDHRLALSLIALDPLTQLALIFVGLPVEEFTAELKARLDRTVPFELARQRVVRGCALRVVPGDRQHPHALGVFVDLAPGGAQGPRDPAGAVNFLADGRVLAFAAAPGTARRSATDPPP